MSNSRQEPKLIQTFPSQDHKKRYENRGLFISITFQVKDEVGLIIYSKETDCNTALLYES